MLYGPEYATWAVEPETCQNCRRPSDNLVQLENGWNYKACPECAEWAHAVEQAETSCPDLHEAVTGARTIDEVRLAMRSHQGATCAACGSDSNIVATDREYLNPAAVCCEEAA